MLGLSPYAPGPLYSFLFFFPALRRLDEMSVCCTQRAATFFFFFSFFLPVQPFVKFFAVLTWAAPFLFFFFQLAQ
jgi:hypothetical protein